MAITKEELIEKLNSDLSKEYAAIVQYTQHSGVITGAMYGSIKKEIIVHASEELMHATTLAGQINHLGGTPTTNVATVSSADDAVGMLEQDLAGENDAVARYSQRVKEAEDLMLMDLAQKLREILAMEQEHAMDLEEALGR